MSGRQPRLFGMNRYSVIQSEFTDEEKERLLALKVPQKDIDNPAKEKDLRSTLKADTPDTPDTSGGCCDGDGNFCKCVGGLLTCYGLLTCCKSD